MLEIILWHVSYFAAIGLYLFVVDKVPNHVDDYQKLSPFVRALTKLLLPLGVLLVYGFCVMNCLLCATTREAFISRFIFQAIGATYISIMAIYWSYKKSFKSKVLAWLPPVLFFLYSLVKNIVVTDGFFPFLWREAISLLILAVGYLIPMGSNLGCVPYEYDKTAVSKDLANENLCKEENTRERWRNDRYDTFDNTDSDRPSHRGFFDDAVEEYEKSRSIRNVSGQGSSRTCANCRHFDGSGCNNPNASAYQTTIWNASDHKCGQHSY